MADDYRELRSEVKSLAGKVDKLQENTQLIARELGVREGRTLDETILRMEKLQAEIKMLVTEVKLDSANIRSNQEYGSNDIKEIKKALAAIYRNTLDLENGLLPRKPVNL